MTPAWCQVDHQAADHLSPERRIQPAAHASRRASPRCAHESWLRTPLWTHHDPLACRPYRIRIEPDSRTFILTAHHKHVPNAAWRVASHPRRLPSGHLPHSPSVKNNSCCHRLVLVHRPTEASSSTSARYLPPRHQLSPDCGCVLWMVCFLVASIHSNVCPCAQGRCGRWPPGSGVISDLLWFPPN